MRFLGLFVAVLASLHAPVLAETQQEKFTALAAQNGGIVPLDAKLFREITASNREWSVSVQLTAMGASFKCMPCREFEPTFKTIGKTWRKVAAAERDTHFFASIDFEKGQEIFRDLGLQSAPVLLTYSPMKGPRASARPRAEPHPYDFQNNGFAIDDLVDELSRYTPVKIPYSKPLPWGLLITGAVCVLSAVVVAPYVLPLLSSRWTWAATTLAFILIMVGGQMFVRIRNTPYVYPQRDGGASWIVSGYQNQLGAEVHAVAIAYGTLGFSMVALNSLVTRVPSPSRQRTSIILWVTVLLVGYSGLLALFRAKSPSYPFKIFF